MGTSQSWVAIRGRPATAVRAELEARESLQVTGDPPAQLGPIRADLEAQQAAAGDDNVDFLFDAPMALAKQLVGYHHFDDNPAESFEALEELPPGPPRKRFWTKLLGR
jgi:hypothetical protein